MTTQRYDQSEVLGPSAYWKFNAFISIPSVDSGKQFWPVACLFKFGVHPHLDRPAEAEKPQRLAAAEDEMEVVWLEEPHAERLRKGILPDAQEILSPHLRMEWKQL